MRTSTAPSVAGSKGLVRALALLAAAAVLSALPAAAHASPSTHGETYHLAFGYARYRASAYGAHGNVGVATFNARQDLPLPQAAKDVERLTSRTDVDIIGLQEANNFGPLYAALDAQGWTVVQRQFSSGAWSELAVAFRTSKFTLVDSQLVLMHVGSNLANGNDRPFPARYVLRVTLRSVATGASTTVFDTHVNQHIERFRDGHPGHPFQNDDSWEARLHLARLRSMVAASTSRYTFVTGDFNWDYVADQETVLPKFVEGRLGGLLVSGWQAFGVAHQAFSDPATKRRIDYVFVTKTSPAKFLAQDVAWGYNSDHRPVVDLFALD